MCNDPYTAHGYKNRNDYLQSLSEDYGVDLETIRSLAFVLGEQEDFDGLVIAVDDYSKTLDF